MRCILNSPVHRNKVEWWLPGLGGGEDEQLLFNGYTVSVGEDFSLDGWLPNSVNVLNTTESCISKWLRW